MSFEYSYDERGVVVSRHEIPATGNVCEQQELFHSLSEDEKYKHTLMWEDIEFEGYCKMEDEMPGTDHLMHHGSFCLFISCNCSEPCELRREKV